MNVINNENVNFLIIYFKCYIAINNSEKINNAIVACSEVLNCFVIKTDQNS